MVFLRSRDFVDGIKILWSFMIFFLRRQRSKYIHQQIKIILMVWLYGHCSNKVKLRYFFVNNCRLATGRKHAVTFKFFFLYILMCLFGVVRLQRPSNEAVKILFFFCACQESTVPIPHGQTSGSYILGNYLGS